jgi:hypothetical protein
MRVLIALAALLSASIALALPAEARQQKQARSTEYSTSRAYKSDYYRGKRARGDAPRLRACGKSRPGRHYKAYPCWARAAFAPKDLP